MKEPKPFAAPKPRLEAGMRTATGAKIQQMESVPYELETDIEHRTQGFVDSLTDNIARIEDLYDRAKAEKYLKQLEDQVSNLAEQDRLSYRLRSWASNQIAAARTRISKGHKAAEGMSEEEQATP
jgi:vacuolar-type H+-ATPase subunit I/STV1